MPRHRGQELHKVLDEVERNVLDSLDVHVIMDNASSHETKLIPKLVRKAAPASALHADILILDQPG